MALIDNMFKLSYILIVQFPISMSLFLLQQINFSGSFIVAMECFLKAMKWLFEQKWICFSNVTELWN